MNRTHGQTDDIELVTYPADWYKSETALLLFMNWLYLPSREPARYCDPFFCVEKDPTWHSLQKILSQIHARALLRAKDFQSDDEDIVTYLADWWNDPEIQPSLSKHMPQGLRGNKHDEIAVAFFNNVIQGLPQPDGAIGMLSKEEPPASSVTLPLKWYKDDELASALIEILTPSRVDRFLSTVNPNRPCTPSRPRVKLALRDIAYEMTLASYVYPSDVSVIYPENWSARPVLKKVLDQYFPNHANEAKDLVLEKLGDAAPFVAYSELAGT
ncbi:hypothetical protein A3709_19855 [Halioglobus sp. HI00S01]|uniref:hypothetical protein n=1 Tax=Halioglobus sp. HI00S01 TaxID=1822214 RepID=UPI0007C39377|nr:hypothetical protein [Halioglobus sp. HI00S01]KZX57880.1 hypothetical protein A3709_19855 [Halioglobus sp. HI00S01]